MTQRNINIQKQFMVPQRELNSLKTNDILGAHVKNSYIRGNQINNYGLDIISNPKNSNAIQVQGKMRNPMYTAFKYVDEEDTLDKFQKQYPSIENNAATQNYFNKMEFVAPQPHNRKSVYDQSDENQKEYQKPIDQQETLLNNDFNQKQPQPLKQYMNNNVDDNQNNQIYQNHDQKNQQQFQQNFENQHENDNFTQKNDENYLKNYNERYNENYNQLNNDNDQFYENQNKIDNQQHYENQNHNQYRNEYLDDNQKHFDNENQQRNYEQGQPLSRQSLPQSRQSLQNLGSRNRQSYNYDSKTLFDPKSGHFIQTYKQTNHQNPRELQSRILNTDQLPEYRKDTEKFFTDDNNFHKKGLNKIINDQIFREINRDYKYRAVNILSHKNLYTYQPRYDGFKISTKSLNECNRELLYKLNKDPVQYVKEYSKESQRYGQN